MGCDEVFVVVKKRIGCMKRIVYEWWNGGWGCDGEWLKYCMRLEW